MDTIFDDKSRRNLIFRIQNLSENDTALWGKMNVYQMIKHCSLWDEWMLGIKKPIYRQEFLGKIFGKMTLDEIGILVYKHTDHHLRQFGK